MKKVAFIIGGSSGIGFSTIELLLQNGYIVYNGSRRKCSDERAESLYIDVSKPKTIKDAVEMILQKQVYIDLLVYSAGFSMASPVEFVERKDYRYLFDINIFGAIEAIQQVVPNMRKQKCGRIIIVSSIGGVIPIPYDSFYSASKAAVDMLTISLNIELRKFNIFVTSILPGGTKTDFTHKRKVYKLEEKIGYEDFDDAVKILGEIEQTGMCAADVAKTIYKIAKSKKPPILVASGLMNKIYYVISKVVPYKIINKIIKIKYKINE